LESEKRTSERSKKLARGERRQYHRANRPNITCTREDCQRMMVDSAIEVDPAHRNSLWIVLKKCLWDPCFKIAILKWNLLGRLAIGTHKPNLDPQRAFLVQAGVFVAVFPYPHFDLAVLNADGSVHPGVALRCLEQRQAFEM